MQRKLEYRSSQSDTALSKTNVPPPILESNTDVELSKNIAPSTAVHSYTVIDPGSLPISTPTGLNKGTVLTPERKDQTPAFGSLVSNSPVSYSPGTVTPTNLPGRETFHSLNLPGRETFHSLSNLISMIGCCVL